MRSSNSSSCSKRIPNSPTGYYLSFYPVCNPTGFEDGTRFSRNGKDLNREFWKNSAEPEVRLLQAELVSRSFQGIISLHTDDSSDGFYGFARGATLTKHLIEPALAAAEKFLPRDVRPVIDGFNASNGIIRDCYDGILSAPPKVRPRPFEIILETPSAPPEYLKELAFVAALETILIEYSKVHRLRSKSLIFKKPNFFVATRQLGAKKNRVLPGFRLTLGYTLFYLGLIVLIPAGGGVLENQHAVVGAILAHASPRRVALASYRLSFGASFLAALVNAVFGLIVAWVLVRYNFFGKTRAWTRWWTCRSRCRRRLRASRWRRFTRPTAGLANVLAPLGIKVAYTRLGIFVALTFIGLPFIVRTVQPVLEDLDPELEEAAASLGANRWQIFWRVIFPMLTPALLTGFALAFARALGEYGSVVFISSNIPMKTQITPLLIMTKLEEFDYAGATAIAVVMLVVSFMLVARHQRAAMVEQPSQRHQPVMTAVATTPSGAAPHSRNVMRRRNRRSSARC